MASHSQPIPMAQPVDQSEYLHASLPSASVPPPPSSSGPSALGNLVAVWATVSDFIGVSIKERTWWHLRHLQQPIVPESARTEGQEGGTGEEAGGSSGDGGMIRVAHCVVGKRSSSHAQRKAKRGSVMAGAPSPSFSTSSSYSPSPAFPALSHLTTALASSASSVGSLSGSRGGSGTTPTVTTLDFDFKTVSPSTGAHNVDEDDLCAMVLMPSTQVFFVYEVQRVVFGLHISRSLFCFQGGVIPAELMEGTLVNALKALVADAAGKAVHAVELFITIVACDLDGGETHTLVQGYPLCRQTLSDLLSRVGPFLNQMENKLVASQQESGASRGPSRDQGPRSSAFEKLVELSLFALQFLPDHAAPSIVLMVDGVFQLGHAAVAEYDDLIMQLCRDDIVLSIVCLAPLQDPSTALGYVGDVQTLETAVKTTGGCVLRAAEVGRNLASHAESATTSMPLRYILAHHAVGVQDMLQASLLVRHSRLNVPVELAAKSSSSAVVVSGAASAAAAAIAAMPMSQPTPATPFTTTRDKLKMYSLPLLRLRMLMELRAAEGFQATVVHLGGAGKATGRARINGAGGGNSSTGKVKQQRRAGARGTSSRSNKNTCITGTTVLVRLTRFLDCNLSVEYTLEYCPLPAAAGQDLGAANVTIDVVGGTDWIRAMTDPHARHEADVLRQSLRRFLRALQDRDIRLCRIMTLLKPRPKMSPPSGGALHPKQARREEEGAQVREVMLWLGQLPLRDWSRWLHVTYFELVTHGEELAEVREESDEEEGEESAAGLESEDRGHGWTDEQLRLRKEENERGEVDEGGGDADLLNLRVREDLLLTLLGRWCTFRAGRDLFAKVLEDGPELIRGHPHRGLRFVLLRLLWASDHLVRLHLGFFGVEGPAARQQVWELQKALISVDGPLLLPKAPLAFQLLLPHPGQSNLGVLPHYPAVQASDMLLRSYLKSRRWSWHLGRYTDLPSIMDTLARAQVAAGFTLIYKDRQQTLLVQHVSLAVTPGDGERDSTLIQQQQQQQQHLHHPGGRGGSGIHSGTSTAAAMRSALVQYRVLVDAPHGLTTEMWMEPQHGLGTVGDHRGPVPEADLWQTLTTNCYERDRRLLSAMDSFLYIRHLCTDAHPELGATAGSYDGSPRRPRCAPHDLNLLEVLRGAEKTELTLRLFFLLAPDQAPLPVYPQDESEAPRAIDGDENNRQLHILTERTLRTLLGTEIPAGSLNAAAKGEEDAAYQARRQGQDLLWKVQLGLTGWREGKCFAHQVSKDALSIWFLAPYKAQEAVLQDTSSGGDIEVARPQMAIKIFIITFQQLLARLIGTTGSVDRRGHQPSAWSSSRGVRDPRAPSPLPSGNPLLAYISYLHRRNFTQVAYMALRCAQPIAPADLRDALGYCSEIGMDVEMTHLRKIALGTTEARQRIKDQAMMRMGGGPSTSAGINDGLGVDIDDGEGPNEEEQKRENKEVASQDQAKPLGKDADREFQRAISSWLAPVPGTDFYYYVGSEEDLYEVENDSWEATTREGSAEDSAVTSSMAPPKIYMRKASDPGAFLGVSAAVSSKRNDGGAKENDAVDRPSPTATTGGIAGLFQQGYEAEVKMMLKMLEVKRRAQARNLNGGRGHGSAAVREDLSFVTPCFVRFEVVHALYGLAQSRVFRITSATPPSTVLPFCFDDAVARENMWVAPRVSRQATSVSIICATHSRLDVAKFEAALERARRQGKETDGEGSSSAGGLSLSKAEAKDLMLTTHKRFLRLVRRRVEAWAAAETLRCLLSLSPLPTMAVPTILQCLRPLPAEAITRVHIKLAFVAATAFEAQNEEDSDDDIGSAGVSSMGGTVPGGSGIPRRGARRGSHQSDGGMESGGAMGGSGGGGSAKADLSLMEQHEEEALELFHEHLAACRFLEVRQAAGMYFVVEPLLPGPPLLSQAAQASSSLCMSPSDWPSIPLTAPSLRHGTPPSSSDTSLRAACAYRIPYWAILQVRRRKMRQETSVSAAMMATSKEDWRKRRASSGGGGSCGDVQREEEPVGGYVDSYEVVVRVHHPPSAPWYEARHEVLENVRAGILALCTHVNQILLLRHLHDTRHASPLLIAPTENDLRCREETGNDGMGGSLSRGGSGRLGRTATTARNVGPLPPYPPPSEQKQRQQDPHQTHQVVGEDIGGGPGRGRAAVLPGHSQSLLPFYSNQFKCPRQLTLRFPVFHRLTPVAALRALESDVLHPLTVQNRVHTFVHRDRHGRVSYLRFEASKRKDSLTSSGHGVYGSSSGGDAPFGLDLDTSGHSTAGGGASAPLIMSTSTSDLAPPHTLSTAAAASGGPAAWIDCHVHGVNEVGEELSVHLHRLLESRLAEISIFHLSELLSRNPRLQLTAQDLDLIKTGTATIPPSAAVAAMGGSVVLPPPPTSTSATTAVGTTGGGRYHALLELPGGLLRYGDPYLFLLYLRQNTARAQFINNIHVSHGTVGGGGSSMMMAASAISSSSLTGGGIFRPGRAPSPHPMGYDSTGSISPGDLGTFGSGRGIEGLSEVWAPERADASTWHPSLIGFTGPRPLEPLSAATSHPAFWSLAGGAEVEIAPGLLNVYYNHNRPEVYEAGRKDVTTTLSSRGARLAKEVGKGLALVNIQPVDAAGNTVRRLRSAVSVTQEEINAVVVAAATTAASGGGRGTDTPLPWAVSILKPSTNMATVPECQQEPPQTTPISPSSSLASSSMAYSRFQYPAEQQQQQQQQPLQSLLWQSPPPLSKAFSHPEGDAGKSRATGGGGLWAISVEILGSVNGEPLLEWLKLCVDQAMHDYFIERLLNYMKNPPHEADDKTFIGRMHKALPPWDQLVRSCLLLDSPSIRRQEGREIIPRSEVAPLVQVVCRGMGHAHPFLQSTLTLLRKALSTATGWQEAGLHLVDPQSLLVTKQGNGGRCEYILLGGLRIGDVALPFSSGSSTASAAPTFASFNSRAAMNKSKSTEKLPPADSLYPTLTASEGATASMGALRMTNRDTACVVRVTADSQSLVLYNCHPELAGRCMAAFGRALALVALERFVAEGIGLQKLGLLPLNLPWWRQIPGFPPLLESSQGRQGPATRHAVKGQQGERGRARSDTTMGTISSPRKEDGGSNTGSSSSSSSSTGGGSDVALSASSQLRPESASSSSSTAESMQRSASYDTRKASRPSISGGASAGPGIRPEAAARGGDLPPGMVMTPAMAARLRASRRGNLPSALRKPTSGPTPTLLSGGAGTAGRGSSDSSSSSFPISSSTTPSGSDVLVKRGASMSVSSTSDRLMLGKGVSSESLGSVSGGVVATPESWLAGPQQWMAAHFAKATPATLQASRQLSQLLRLVLPDVWALVPFKSDQTAGAVGSSSTSNIIDPTRLHLRRLWDSTLPYFADLEIDDRIRELCSTWTWFQHFLQQQQRSAHLHTRVRRPLEVDLKQSRRTRGGKSDNAASGGASLQGTASAAKTAVSLQDFEFLLRRARWHGSWCVPLMERWFSSPLPLSIDTSRLDSEVFMGLDLLALSSPLLRAFPSPSPRPPSRSGAMTPALERRNNTRTLGSSPTSVRARPLPPASPSSSVSSMTIASPSQLERPSSAAPFLESDASAAARRSSWVPAQEGVGREDGAKHATHVRAATMDEGGPRFFSRSSTISVPPSRMMARHSSRSSTLSDDQGLVSTLSTSYSSRQIGAWAEKDRKKQGFGDEKTRPEVKKESPDTAAATLAHEALLREKEKDDFALAKGFLHRYTSYLQDTLKMTLVLVANPSTKSSSSTQEGTAVSPPAHDWSSLKAYLHRFVALTNTVTIVEVECERRCVSGSGPDGSEVRIKLSLYTLDIQSTNSSSANTGSKSSNSKHPHHVPSHVGAAAAMASLPTTHTFAWSGGGGSVGNLGASPGYYQQHAHGHLQLPQDVALSISQLNLETQVYDYLVNYIMQSLLDKGREERNEEGQEEKEEECSGGNLAALESLFGKSPEPPSQSQTAIGVRHICQPVHEAVGEAEGTGLVRQQQSFNSPTALLRHMQEHHRRYHLWPLQEVDRKGRLTEALVGAVSIKTWRPVDPKDREREETLLFVLIAAEESAPAEYLMYIMHRKGKERGQRGSFMEIPGHVQELVTRTLEAASFDYSKERIWDRIADCLARGEEEGRDNGSQVAVMMVMGVEMAAPTPIIAPPVLPSPTFGDRGEGVPPFTSHHLNTLLCFSPCQPLVQVDPRLSSLFASSITEEDLQVPWLDVLSYLETDAFWRLRAVCVQGLREEAGEKDLLLCCDDDGGNEAMGKETDITSKQGGGCLLPNVRSLLHFSVRRRGRESYRLKGQHPQEMAVQLIYRDEAHRELTQGQQQYVSACIGHILGWIWLHVLAPEG